MNDNINLEEQYKKRLKENYRVAMQVIKDVFGEEKVSELMCGAILLQVNSTAVGRAGICKRYRGKGYCTIEVSEVLFQLSDDEIINTLIHEILHTFKDTDGHKGKWKIYADEISKNTKYKITRLADSSNIVIDYRYQITCKSCGLIKNNHRLSKKKINQYKDKKIECPKCKYNEFTIKDLKKDIMILE